MHNFLVFLGLRLDRLLIDNNNREKFAGLIVYKPITIRKERERNLFEIGAIFLYLQDENTDISDRITYNSSGIVHCTAAIHIDGTRLLSTQFIFQGKKLRVCKE